MNRAAIANKVKRGEHFLGNASFFGLRYLSRFSPLSSILLPMTGYYTFSHAMDDLRKMNFFGTASNCLGFFAKMLFLEKMPPSEKTVGPASQVMGVSSFFQALQEAHHLLREGFDSRTVLNMLMELINAVSLFKDPTNEDTMLFLTMANLAFCAYSFNQHEESERRQEVVTPSRDQLSL